MKNIASIVLLAFCSISLTAQSVDVDRGCLPLDVTFTGVANLQDYFWSFGDGASSVLQDPMHTYITAGTYEAVLREGQNGPERARITIEVYPRPEVTITLDQDDICAPSDVTFDLDLNIEDDVPITAYNWSISGAIDTVAMPSFTFNSAGLYTIGVQVETDLPGCNTSTVQQDFVEVQGTAALFSFFTDNPCEAPATTSFTNATEDLADLTYSWDFGNGQTSQLRNPVDVTYTDEGVYDVVLTVTSTDGCVSTLTRPVQVGLLTQLAEIPDTICINVPITIVNNTDAVQNIWFAPGSFPASSTSREPQFLFDNAGPTTIRYTSVLRGGCRVDSTYEVFIQDPTSDVMIDPAVSCQDPYLFTAMANPTLQTYIWDGDTTMTSTYSGNYSVARDSQYLHQIDTVFVPFVGISFSGCVVTDTFAAIQRRPNAELTVNQTRGCAPLSVTFSDISTSFEDINDYTWLLGDGTVITNDGTDLPHTYASPGVYDVRLIIENEAGCRDTSNVLNIYVGEPITPDLEDYSFDICLGETISLETTTQDPRIEAYQWVTDGGRQSDCWTDQTATVTFDKDPGTYDITLTTEYNGCRTTVTRSGAVRVGGASAHVGYQTDCDSIYDVDFIDRGVGGTERLWDFAGLATSTDLEPRFTFPDTGDYVITLITSDPASGCPADTARQTVHIRDLKAVLDIPEVGCDNEAVILSAANSQHVHNDCFRGYVWEMPFQRPRELPQDSVGHLFRQTGANLVRVTVRDVNGCLQVAEDTIQIYGIDPDFTVSDTSICLPATMSIDNNTVFDTTIVSWDWSFGSTRENPANYLIDDSNFEPFISLTVEDAIGCRDSVFVPIQRYIPASQISVDPRRACFGDTIRLAATDFTQEGSRLRWNWDLDVFGNRTGQSPSFIANQEGSFPLSVTYEELSSGCEATTNFTITVVPTPVASFISDAGTATELCFNDVIRFTNTSDASDNAVADWDFGGLGTFTGDTSQFIFPRGTFDVSMTVTDPAGCSDTESTTYTFVGPDGELSSNRTTICFGDDISFELSNVTSDVTGISWSFGDGTSATDVNSIMHTYDTPLDGDSTFVSVVLTAGDSNCENVLSLPINFLETEASFLPDSATTFCPNDNIAFTNTSINANTYQWNFGDGDLSDLTNPSRSFSVRDTYPVTLIATIDSLGCSDTITQDVIISVPAVGLTTEPVCDGDTAIIVIDSYDPSIDYQVEPLSINATVNSNGTISIPGLSATTEITVTALDNSACEASETLTIQVIPLVDDQEIDLSAFEGDILTLPVDPAILAVAGEYDISVDNDNLLCNDCLDLIFADGVTRLDSMVTVTLGSVCGDAQLTYRIAVTGCEFYPNLFSPNADGNNEIFNFATRSAARSAIEIEAFQIYDRWGTLVFDNDSRRGWDGLMPNGDNASTDVFSWFSVITVSSGESRTCKGNITLVR